MLLGRGNLSFANERPSGQQALPQVPPAANPRRQVACHPLPQQQGWRQSRIAPASLLDHRSSTLPVQQQLPSSSFLSGASTGGAGAGATSMLPDTSQERASALRSFAVVIVKACTRVACAAALLFAAQHLLAPSHALAATGTSTASSNPIAGLLDFVLHLDHHMSGLVETHGPLTYGILWAIVFCETGLVLTPFLPGDSLLFAAGAFAGMGKLCVWRLVAVFLSSAILGDAVNYLVGSKLGALALSKNIIKQEYIAKTEAFYDKYGGKTVVLARFVPIVRTFAPFVAGVGSMPYGRFGLYNVLGAVIWTILFLGAGFFFGNLPFVQKNFTLVVLAIVAVSVVPIGIEVLNARKEEQQKGQGA